MCGVISYMKKKMKRIKIVGTIVFSCVMLTVFLGTIVCNMYISFADTSFLLPAILKGRTINGVEMIDYVSKNSKNVDALLGDVDNNGEITSKDLICMRKYMTNHLIEINRTNADINADGRIDSLDLICLRKIILKNNDSIHRTVLTYGKSVLGRDLVCYSIAPKEYSRTILLNFEIHGWEDEYSKDGQQLVDLGNYLVEYYATNKNLNQCRLLIIPSANPDGVQEGITNNGFGRCNAEGIDLNRDFDADYQKYLSERNYTQFPFSACESRALRDLVLKANPEIVIDFHGWENCTIGSPQLAEVFSMYVGINHKTRLTASAHGYFSYWAQKQGAEALLVEFKNSASLDKGKVVRAINKLIENDYGLKEHTKETDKEYGKFCPISTYTLSGGKVYTQMKCGEKETGYGYINGETDLCTITQVYNNGWCKVNYPASNNFTKTGYCELSNFIDATKTVESYSENVKRNTTVYRTKNRKEKIGTVWETDEIKVIAQEHENVQIIYPLDNGGYKMGWILKKEIEE